MLIQSLSIFFCTVHILNTNGLIITKRICYFNTIQFTNTDAIRHNTSEIIRNAASTIAFN